MAGGYPPRAAVSLLLLLLSPAPSSAALRARRRYDSIFVFGDSFTDTGNNPAVFAWYSVFNPVMRPPYGSTFFGFPTGRNCDGRLAIDFIAEGLGVPLVPPFLAHDGSFRRGANFAVGGATAIDAAFFHDGEPPAGADDKYKFPLNTSLGVQLQWFESLVPSLCATTQECEELFGRSLFFIGELGFNDYSFSLTKGKSVQQLRSLLVPDVIKNISMAIERLIKHGATSLVVSGMVPAGCEPPILDLFSSADDPAASYDPRTGCLKEMNELSIHHNTLLQESLEKIRTKHQDVEIIYADFFSPIMEMVESPAKFEDALTVCCGGPGRNHFSTVILCGDTGSTTCKDPSARLFWDGAHLTEAANRYIADGWLRSISSPATATN
ncbi:unnamed protein product [Urochloa decumbens]|uniref:GDSL esterase/lipase n=1 Tax=Urochloa decumbens TaxID=240449 RepID=A0ABC9AJ02_9POAL